MAMNEMNYEHLANNTFPGEDLGAVFAAYEKPVWKMDLIEVKQELQKILQKSLVHNLDDDEKEKREKLLNRQKELE